MPFPTPLAAVVLLAAGPVDDAPPTPEPRGYVAHRASGPIEIDGTLDDKGWDGIPWTDPFDDIEGDIKPDPRFRTRAKMAWDDSCFYIAAMLEEPHVRGAITEHDAVIFRDNDFEVFIDPDGDNHQYYEFEINALNTGWDLRLVKPYRDGGPALNEWEIAGLRTGVHVRGTLNDPTDEDEGWSVEIALPWEALAEFTRMPCPPRDGDRWRVNFSRVEWRHTVIDGHYETVPDTREDNWVWSPQGVVDMHRPERWGDVLFSIEPIGTVPFRPDPARSARDRLHLVYEAQRRFRSEHGRYADSIADLGLDDEGPPIELTVTPDGFNAALGVPGSDGEPSRCWEIRQDSLLEATPAPSERP